jgi:hypothetical protein
MVAIRSAPEAAPLSGSEPSPQAMRAVVRMAMVREGRRRLRWNKAS